MLNNLLTLIIAPVVTGIVIELFSYWLNKKDDN
ncbi:type I toxin-antitoxin system Fst family toxin [Periweissella fabaria]|uniref:Type I toxin-antitoxin system Fst family toxin n=1 Tax=Periweissella fabalis TaxID=1070421 RepID=A0A7X6N3B7_9LACO|nr:MULTISPECIES: type I toxin-antitoxin system Fst family toxin [Periweissella]MCM0596342.1 type I toxin-antitoxin system Fst family toxin [Periweissella fabaria]MCM0598420.1 type I toxin-antitoxin system Fst family toxin [Periweissella fabalis]NKZ24928.1 type I toxin-antitoxin system Fst family toxin [Periweissella fabalis]